MSHLRQKHIGSSIAACHHGLIIKTQFDRVVSMPSVVFPCTRDTWIQVKSGLLQLQQNLLQGQYDFVKLAIDHQAIVNLNLGITEQQRKGWGDAVFYGLVKYFKKHATVDERNHFLTKTLPSIIDLALRVEELLPEDGISIVEQQKGESTDVSRHLCCAIVACGFLCLFPNEHRGFKSKLNIINFNKFFANLPLPSQNAKLRCILHFFDRVAEDWSRLTGSLIFVRQVIKREELPTFDTWLNCTAKLCNMEIHRDGLIEEAGAHVIEVDFANRYIGGGVLGRGRVQEEIRFAVCPELIVSMLFMEVMEENEAIVIQGFEQFSAVQGYASSLLFAGDYRDSAEVDKNGNLMRMLSAIDAVSYRYDTTKRSSRQYDHQWILRDLNKAFTGFCVPITGLPEEHVNEEEYVTSEEDNVQENEINAVNKFHIFTERFLHDVMSQALSDASKHFNTREDIGLMYATSALTVGCDLPHQSCMDHLEVSYRDWYTQYRRRSSNLSDLSSRHSSYDLSRRSSVSSARGYSSECSSELEDYLVNFQMQENRYKYHTIKEETASASVIEYASNLARNLVQTGVDQAVNMNVFPRKFHEELPKYFVNSPVPVKLTLSSEPSSDTLVGDQVSSSETTIRLYVDRLFHKIWPFKDEYVNFSDESEDLEICEYKQVIQQSSPKDGQTCSIIDSINVTEGSYIERNQMQQPEHSEQMSNPIYDDILLAVAEKLVSNAFEEALQEYKYSIPVNAQRNAVGLSYSESSQSDHSIASKDQSDNSIFGCKFFKNSNSNSVINSKTSDAARRIAEKVISGLFSKKFGQEMGTVQGACYIPHNCDTYLPIVDNVPLVHSSNNSHSADSDKIEIFHVNDVTYSDPLSVPELENSDNNYCNKHRNLGRSTANSHFSDVRPDLANFLDQPTNRESCICSGHVVQAHSNTTLEQYMYFDNSLHKTDDKLYEAQSDDPSSRTSSPRHITYPLMNKFTKQVSTSNYKEMADYLKVERNTNSDSSLNNTSSSENTSSDSSLPKEAKGGVSRISPSTSILSKHRKYKVQFKGRGDFSVGNKKNYYQFANSLSRDLLTNAFLQVQEHSDFVTYPRRSSEPMQISNGAALQRLDHSVHGGRGTKGQKSKTDEDISSFEDDWLQEYSGPSSRGFRDPVLSRFAEELMKVNISVPTLHLVTGDNISVSESSRSMCSTVSSFHDPILASFEEELLSVKPTGNTQTSWSTIKGNLCSPRQTENSNSSCSYGSRQQLHCSVSDSEASAMSSRSYFAYVSQFAELLATQLTCEALTSILILGQNADNIHANRENLVMDLYCDMLARSILQMAIVQANTERPDWLEQNRMVTWSDEMHCVHFSDTETLETSSNERLLCGSEETDLSSQEYVDALDIPYEDLEEFADNLAGAVLDHSVAIYRRDNQSTLRRQFGRPISTGNWGCGAFQGDPQLKSILQWMAASYAGAPCMMYYTFQNPKMDKDVVDIVCQREWDVSRLMQVVHRYCITAKNEIDCNGTVSRNLFDVLLRGDFPWTLK